eukprot:6211300-Pleurochrysis_carterae.AAC.2
MDMLSIESPLLMALLKSTYLRFPSFPAIAHWASLTLIFSITSSKALPACASFHATSSSIESASSFDLIPLRQEHRLSNRDLPPSPPYCTRHERQLRAAGPTASPLPDAASLAPA